jgi:hypothetical protein
LFFSFFEAPVAEIPKPDVMVEVAPPVKSTGTGDEYKVN